MQHVLNENKADASADESKIPKLGFVAEFSSMMIVLGGAMDKFLINREVLIKNDSITFFGQSSFVLGVAAFAPSDYVGQRGPLFLVGAGLGAMGASEQITAPNATKMIVYLGGLGLATAGLALYFIPKAGEAIDNSIGRAAHAVKNQAELIYCAFKPKTL